jgi:hypothetical protein
MLLVRKGIEMDEGFTCKDREKKNEQYAHKANRG